MKKKFSQHIRRGLPGGANEVSSHTTGMISREGYRSNSPDKDNPFNVINSSSITMTETNGEPLKKGPLFAMDNLGNKQIMMPGFNYQFPGSQVLELPMAEEGMIVEASDEEIEEYKRGGYIVEELHEGGELPKAQLGKYFKQGLNVLGDVGKTVVDETVNVAKNIKDYAEGNQGWLPGDQTGIKEGVKDLTEWVEDPNLKFRTRLKNSITPIGYSWKHAAKEFAAGKQLPFTWDGQKTTFKDFDKLDRWKDPKTGKLGSYGKYVKDASSDAWNMYLGFDQEHDTYGISKYKPSSSKNKNAKYYSFNWDDDIWDEVIDNKIFNLKTGQSKYIKDSGSGGFTLKNYKLGKGYDKELKLPYISYYDKNDYNIDFGSFGLKGEDIVGESFEVYDRMYYDPKTKKRVFPESKPKKHKGGESHVHPHFKTLTSDGGYIDTELDEEEIKELQKGGYIVEELPSYQEDGEVDIETGTKIVSAAPINKETGGCPEDHYYSPKYKRCIKKETTHPEVTVYGDEEGKKKQRKLRDNFQLAQTAFKNWHKDAGFGNLILKGKRDKDDIKSLSGYVDDYKEELKKVKQQYKPASSALKTLKKYYPKDWKKLKLKHVFDPQSVEQLRKLYKEDKISESTFRWYYDSFGKGYDKNVAKGTGTDATYSAKETKDIWRDTG